jgi:hypothetical protein
MKAWLDKPRLPARAFGAKGRVLRPETPSALHRVRLNATEAIDNEEM